MEALRYLEAAKIAEVEADFTAKGYHVVVQPQNGQERMFDLIAEKPGRKIAVDVAARASLGKSRAGLANHRKVARELGFDSYELVVVNPPHRTDVKIEGFEQSLVTYLTDHPAPELKELVKRETDKRAENRPWPFDCLAGDIKDLRIGAGGDAVRAPMLPTVAISPLKVEQVDFDQVDFKNDQIRTIGDGLLIGIIVTNLHESSDCATSPISMTSIDFPFRFDLILNREGKVIAANEIRVDTSSFDD